MKVFITRALTVILVLLATLIAVDAALRFGRGDWWEATCRGAFALVCYGTVLHDALATRLWRNRAARAQVAQALRNEYFDGTAERDWPRWANAVIWFLEDDR